MFGLAAARGREAPTGVIAGHLLRTRIGKASRPYSAAIKIRPFLRVMVLRKIISYLSSLSGGRVSFLAATIRGPLGLNELRPSHDSTTVRDCCRRTLVFVAHRVKLGAHSLAFARSGLERPHRPGERRQRWPGRVTDLDHVVTYHLPSGPAGREDTDTEAAIHRGRAAFRVSWLASCNLGPPIAASLHTLQPLLARQI